METYSCPICRLSVPVQNQLVHSAICNRKNASLPLQTSNQKSEAEEVEWHELCGPGSNTIAHFSSDAEGDGASLCKLSNSHEDDSWSCPQCTFCNPSQQIEAQCAVCGYSSEMQVAPTSAASSLEAGTENRNGIQYWSCPECTLLNPSNDSRACLLCEAPRQIPAQSIGSIEVTDRECEPCTQMNRLTQSQSDDWNCSSCTYANQSASLVCEVCGTARELRSPRSAPQNPRDNSRDDYMMPAILLGAIGGAALSRGKLTGVVAGASAGALLGLFLSVSDSSATDGASQGTRAVDDMARSSMVLTREMRSLDDEISLLRNRWITVPDAVTYAGASRNASTLLERMPMKQICDEDMNGLKSKVPEPCGICLEAYKAEDNVTTLPCFHEFHHQCILRWIRQAPTCPICKLSLI